jgi:integrase
MAGARIMLMTTVESYLEVRRTMGFDLRTTERLLRGFADFAALHGDDHVRTETAVQWASRARTIRESDYRLRRVVLFARHARAEDPQHEVPPDGVFRYPPGRHRPHIFTPEEIQRLLSEASQLGPPGSLRPHTFAALFALLFATGLRISEALALRFEDIGPEGLTVRKTKFRKTRFVPLHESAQDGIRRYIARRLASSGMGDHVFININGEPLRRGAVRHAFDRIRVNAGLVAPGQRGPRIHDARHTFAVRALEASPEGRDRIGQHMLALATYLGHGNVADTYWYLHATPCLMHDIADACGALFGGTP